MTARVKVMSYTVIAYSYKVDYSSVMHIIVKATPINEIDYSCHVIVAEPV